MKNPCVDVLPALPEGGQIDRHGADPVEQVFTEQVIANPPVQVAVGGRNQAKIGTNLPLAPQGPEGPLLKHPQKGLLDLQRQFADLIEKQRAAVRLIAHPY